VGIVIVEFRERSRDRHGEGEGVGLPSSPVLTLGQIYAARRSHMRKLRNAGYSIEVIAEYFNVSQRTVMRATSIPRGVRLADGRA
jgi:hypothetical protein